MPYMRGVAPVQGPIFCVAVPGPASLLRAKKDLARNVKLSEGSPFSVNRARISLSPGRVSVVPGNCAAPAGAPVAAR